MNQPKLLDTVTNLQSIPQEKLTLLEREIAYLPKGQVGTIVEVYHQENKNCYLREFADLEGCEYAMATLTAEEILVLNCGFMIALSITKFTLNFISTGIYKTYL